MTIEIALLISGVSVAFAVFFGLSTRARNIKKDTQDEAREGAAVVIKLDTIQTTMIELKTEVKGYREEVRELSTQAVRNEESLKSLHKRVDKMEKLLRLSDRGGTDD